LTPYYNTGWGKNTPSYATGNRVLKSVIAIKKDKVYTDNKAKGRDIYAFDAKIYGDA
jgi:hypothetical protein